jgi:hypothetical protein
MQLHEYVAQLQEQLAAAAALGDEHTRRIAESLVAAAGPAIQLAVLAAVSAAAEEITGALLDSPGAPAVSVRLDGSELRVDVHSTAADEPAPPPADDGDATARISLRLPEALKSEIEAAAKRSDVSVNTWLNRAAFGALTWPAHPRWPEHPVGGHGPAAHRITGWLNG